METEPSGDWLPDLRRLPIDLADVAMRLNARAVAWLAEEGLAPEPPAGEQPVPR